MTRAKHMITLVVFSIVVIGHNQESQSNLFGIFYNSFFPAGFVK